ncbi:MAG: NTP transferase domain-containing protein [Candidatus Omnitrophica bacterium]|nr:NTP transferase domain-containing protein [Candidatus Omnitrophota bacterium]MCM8828886.1 NTP transferase domain-containing protein [Candidatus Omnitrophota bacterium]
MKKIAGIVLAGGKSSRYGLNKHKFLIHYQGKPLITIIIEAIQPVVDRIVILTGPENSEIKQTLINFSFIEYAIQHKPLGTGHALLCTDYIFEKTQTTILVSYADKPLITTKTLKNLIDSHIKNNADITVATAILANPGSKGRIIRINGRFSKVVEAKDADEEILKINEVNAGFIVCESESIYRELRKITNNNASGEYYLTDVYAEYLKDGLKINLVEIPPEESCDINTIAEFKRVEKWIKTVKKEN